MQLIVILLGPSILMRVVFLGKNLRVSRLIVILQEYYLLVREPVMIMAVSMVDYHRVFQLIVMLHRKNWVEGPQLIRMLVGQMYGQIIVQ